MENRIEPRGIYYNPFKTEDKHFFGSYFNLADNNIKEVFDEVKNRFKIKNNGNPIFILKEMFKEDMSFTDYEKYVNTLEDYFPVVKFLDQKNSIEESTSKEKSKTVRISYFREHFIMLIDAIINLRNYYTHFHHEPISIDNKLFRFMDNALLSTVLGVKKNYLKTDHTKELLSDKLKKELEKLYHKKLAYFENKKAEVDKRRAEQKRQGKPQDPVFRFKGRKEIINSIYNDAFKTYLFEKGEKVEISKRKRTAYSTEDLLAKEVSFELPISTSGIIFLLSFFLNRHEIESMKSFVMGYKGKIAKEDNPDLEKNSIRFMATHRIYSVLCYKGLKRKIKTSPQGNKETLLMQMVDELSKVPDVVYKNLPDHIQYEFVEDWNKLYEDEEDLIESQKDESDNNEELIHPVIRKRYEDKFNYFALRFLDEFANFPTLRFQIYLGNYVHHTTDKNVGSAVTNRLIKEKLNVFAKLSEVNQSKSDYFLELPTGEADGYWEVFPNPSYNFPKENAEEFKDANKIAFYVALKDDRIIKAIGEAKNKSNLQQRKSGKPSKNALVNEILGENNIDAKVGEAVAYLSMNDIHSIIFALLVQGQTGAQIEKRIVDKLHQQYLEISECDLKSKVFRKQLNNCANASLLDKKLKRDFKEEKKEIDRLISEAKERETHFVKTQKIRNYEPKRKHLLYNSEKGQIAIWIANDIKRFFPEEFKQNWKGYQHSELQRSFAYFETNKSEIKQQLKGLSDKDFPFQFFSCFKNNNLLREIQ